MPCSILPEALGYTRIHCAFDTEVQGNVCTFNFSLDEEDPREDLIAKAKRQMKRLCENTLISSTLQEGNASGATFLQHACITIDPRIKTLHETLSLFYQEAKFEARMNEKLLVESLSSVLHGISPSLNMFPLTIIEKLRHILECLVMGLLDKQLSANVDHIELCFQSVALTYFLYRGRAKSALLTKLQTIIDRALTNDEDFFTVECINIKNFSKLEFLQINPDFKYSEL